MSVLEALLEPQERFDELCAVARSRFGRGVIDLSCPNPCDGPDDETRRALRLAIDDDRELGFQDTEYGGRTVTRRLIASRLAQEYGLPFTYRDVVLTAGAAAALNIVLRTQFGSADEVVVLTPCWLDYSLYLQNLGIPIQCGAGSAPPPASAENQVGRQEPPGAQELHARFGGDEFCFLIPRLQEHSQAHAIGERFRNAVAQYDWTFEDDRLAAHPVLVDVGLVCLWRGRVAERRFIARRLSANLIQGADKLMYEAKGERASRIRFERVGIKNGELVALTDLNEPAAES